MLVALVTLLLGVVVLLAIPIDVAFVVQRKESLQGRVTVGWLFGLVRIPVRPAPVVAKSRPPRQPKAQRARARRAPRRRRHVWAMLRTEGFLARVLRLVRGLIGRLHIRRLRLHVRLGLDDPADTGRLWGVVGPLAWAVPAPAGGRVAIEPDFTGASFRVDGVGTIRIVPIEIVATLLAFALSPVAWRALRALSTGR